jgi:hypothetical protein
MVDSKQSQNGSGGQPVLPKVGDYVQWESNGQIQFEAKRIRGLSPDNLWAFVDGSDTGLPIEELTIVNTEVTDKLPESNEIGFVTPKPPNNAEKLIHRDSAPKMRSYSWALSGDFNAKMDLFGEARTEEDIDALADYVKITINALKRSLKTQSSGTKD